MTTPADPETVNLIGILCILVGAAIGGFIGWKIFRGSQQ